MQCTSPNCHGVTLLQGSGRSAVFRAVNHLRSDLLRQVFDQHVDAATMDALCRERSQLMDGHRGGAAHCSDPSRQVSVLHLASLRRLVWLVERLVKHGMDVDSALSSSQANAASSFLAPTPLEAVVVSARPDNAAASLRVVECLLRLGAKTWHLVRGSARMVRIAVRS